MTKNSTKKCKYHETEKSLQYQIFCCEENKKVGLCNSTSEIISRLVWKFSLKCVPKTKKLYSVVLPLLRVNENRGYKSFCTKVI